MSHQPLIKRWSNPQPQDIADTVTDFIRQLDQATLIHLSGKNPTRKRMVTTLLHGNELSGTTALHQLLQQGIEPAIDMYYLIASVKTTLLEPVHSHRQPPQQRDLNRCFTQDFNDDIGQLANAIREVITELKPECLIDIHNTSGDSPSFSVCCRQGPEYKQLTALFTSTMIVTDIQLGALMELTSDNCPIITIECGGAKDSAANQCALQGLIDYSCRDEILSPPSNPTSVTVLDKPLRIELCSDSTLCVGDAEQPQSDLTLLPTIEDINANTLEQDTHIGWLGRRGLSIFKINAVENHENLHDIFRLSGNALHLKAGHHCFMFTRRTDIALSDCLGYIVPT